MKSVPVSNGQPLRAAVVGLGRMGVRHLEAVNRLGMSVVGLADMSTDAAVGAGAAIGVAPEACFTDAAEMFRSTRPEAVVIATTAPAHASLVLAAVEAGAKYILCEKPMAASLAEVDAMTEACAAAGAVLAVNHQMRFMANYSHVKTLIGGDELGPLISMVVAGSNFGLAMNASHYFEAFRFLTGSRVASVQAWLETDALTNPRGTQFDDRSGRLLAMNESGQALYIDFSAQAGWGLQVVYICRNGQIVLDELNGDVRVAARQAEFRDLPTSRYGMPVDIRQEAIAPAETVECTMAVWNAMIAGDGYPGADVGEHALSCLVAAHLSDRAGGVPVSTNLPEAARQERFAWA
jgi:predicted dehydrogenase